MEQVSTVTPIMLPAFTCEKINYATKENTCGTAYAIGLVEKHNTHMSITYYIFRSLKLKSSW